MKFKDIESKWQNYWYNSNNLTFDSTSLKDKNYTLEMLYYPSGKFHVGHLRLFTIGDAVARANRLKGFNVLHPMGADAFGLPAENAAIQNKIHPARWTYDNIEIMNNEIKKVGISYDWTKTLNTCDPDYIKQEQAIFINLFNNKLFYKKKSLINWDPVDQTVLSNEQVTNGKGWRSGATVEKREMNQWFFKITHYAEQLLQDLKPLNWSEKIKKMQEKWIGKSDGVEIDFEIIKNDKIKNDKITIFTTRPETIYGVTSIAISFDHPIALELEKCDIKIKEFIIECKMGSVAEEEVATRQKRGIYTNIFAINPISNQKIPILITNYVLMNYGTGAIMMVPAHDQRDFDCIKECFPEMKIRYVIDSSDLGIEGMLINSNLINKLHSKDDKAKILEILQNTSKNIRKKVIYKLRDWCISRQRYWGCPIPIVYCDSCGTVHEKEEKLPILLPEDAIFDGKGNPLDNHPTWKYCKCPKCGKDAIRETDTMDTYVQSSWYFLRYINPKLNDKPFDPLELKYSMPVDLYLGGPEHATTHMMYARAFMKAMRDCGYFTDFQGDITCEPFKTFIATGMVCHKTYQDQDGNYLYPNQVELQNESLIDIKTKSKVIIGPSIKMSKSKKNVVEPSDVIIKYGADAIRFFILSDNPIDNDFNWNENGLKSAYDYINRVFNFFIKNTNKDIFSKSSDPALKNILSKLTNEYIDNFDQMKFNISNAKFREFFSILSKDYQKLSYVDYQEFAFKMLMLISPVVPHLTSEISEILAFDNTFFKWQKNNLLEKDEIKEKFIVQLNGKFKGFIFLNQQDLDIEKIIQKIKEDHKLSKFYRKDIINFKINKFINFKES